MEVCSWPLLRAAIAETDHSNETHQNRAERREPCPSFQIARRHLGIGRQAVNFRLVDQQVKGIQTAEHLLVGAVKVGALFAHLMQLLDALLCAHFELLDRAELDRLRRARLRARGLHAGLQTVVAERALLRRARSGVDVDHAERARRDAIAAAVACIGLNNDGVELGADDRAGRTDLQTRRLNAVFAYIAHQQPTTVFAVVGELLDELHVAPMNAVQRARVVVAVAGERGLTAVPAGELVPLLAGDLARFTADAHRRVGVKSHWLSHRSPQAFSTLQTKALPSCIETFGSPTRAVSSFTTSPVERPS